MKRHEFEHDHINWSIYKNSMDEENDLDVDDWELNLDAPAEVADGVYDCDYHWEISDPGVKDLVVKASGITVKDGKFDPVPTADAVYEAVKEKFKACLAKGLCEMVPMAWEDGKLEVGHHFLEGLDWNGEYFVCVMGS